MNRIGYKQDWYKEWFGDDYIEVYAHRDYDDARQLTRLIKRIIPIHKQSYVLDAACGNGRHAYFLSEICDHVVGVDLSYPLLLQARKNHRLELVRGDIRYLPFPPIFNVVLSLFTSFGYFYHDIENLQVLKEFHRVLKSDGFFLIDYLNRKFVEDHLREETIRIQDEKEIHEKRKIIEERVVKKIVIRHRGQERTYYESVRMYSEVEMRTMLKKAGFVIHKTLGDYQGNPFSHKSPRMIFLLSKMAEGDNEFHI